ncbi:GPI mannosyltransferase, putative [Metarhizium acridum CQMa 102]|uniref:Mannosyltransferase n=2 Tax=Metarhizium acridum TaxID=92637 RepID=E9DZS2_METAQ|nr:GPI mannosyltransferase, putative [Metarhizium acridum CQMa 102]EFY90757.1 GPI mannosyltransferase, putative [Metarhizium acridum CQMa 102]
MWRRTYLLLVLIRLWFALSPSYLHPDENFQGPEVIAGQIFSYPVRRTWEFTSEHPIRSVFPLWPVYGLPMLLLRWLWIGNGHDGEIPPIAVFWTLRVLMFLISFVLEDWALHELIPSPRHRRVAVLLVASSLEFGFDSAHCGYSAIALDTAFYSSEPVTWADLISRPTITPLNFFLYNSDTANLAQHGIHPWYQHVAANLPQLLGPAAVLVFAKPHLSLRLYSAISGLFVLSIFPHQEARFLLPTVPLILSSVELPKNKTMLRTWAGAWIIFNLFLGVLMGIYHQGGVVPGQVFMSKQPDATQAIWWKTYTPPIWLLNGKNEVLQTRDVMGLKGDALLTQLTELATCDTPADRRNQEYLKEKNGTYLIAPASATWLDPYLSNKGLHGLRFREVWRYRKHLNLDDLDFGDDGIWNTLSRVIGRRGLIAWRVTKSCPKTK